MLLSAFESSRNERIPCECCGSLKFIPVHLRENNTLVVHCEECHLEFVNPLPTVEAMHENYQKEMTGNEAESGLHSSYIGERQARIKSFSKLYNSRLSRIESLYSGKGSLLDIGCGAGFFLNCAKERGWNCHGLEILPEYIKFAQENFALDNIRLESLDESLSYDANTFDVITLWDLIEHLRNPLDCLKRIHRVMKPDGLLVMWTPNVKNAVFLKENWVGYETLQHFYFFSRDSLNQMLEKAGFKIVHLETNKARKGLLNQKGFNSYDNSAKPNNIMGKFLRSAKRDLKNTLNPLTYIGPLFDMAGYGFNLHVIASKQED
jgi:2-polyprenyl-3-methyl-5-hydroxy-6-metoxy-1,4-benzoquinol methylase